MKKYTIFLFVLFFLASCETADRENSTSGKILADRYLSSITICLDKNDNFECEEDEPVTISESDGSYSVKSFIKDENSEISHSLVTKGEIKLISLPSSPMVISPLTTITAFHIRKNEISESSAITELEELFETSSLKSDYIESGNYANRLLASAIYNHYIRLNHQSGYYLPEHINLMEEVYNTIISESGTVKSIISNIGKNSRSIQLRSGKRANTSREVMPIARGMGFGTGYDMLSGQILSVSNCLEPKSMNVMKTAEYREREFKYSIIDDATELLRDLDISAKFSLETITFKISLEGSFYKTVRENKNNVFILIKISEKVGDWKLSLPKLKENYDLLHKNNYSEFRKKCGDKFLNTITTGKQFFVLAEIQARNELEKMEITAGISGTYRPVDASVSANFRYLIRDLNNKYSAKYHIMSRGTKNNVNSIDEIAALFDEDTDYNEIFSGTEAVSSTNNPFENSVMAVFENYDQISVKGVADKSAIAHAEKIIIRSGELNSGYDTIQQHLEKTLITPYDYEVFDDSKLEKELIVINWKFGRY